MCNLSYVLNRKSKTNLRSKLEARKIFLMCGVGNKRTQKPQMHIKANKSYRRRKQNHEKEPQQFP